MKVFKYNRWLVLVIVIGLLAALASHQYGRGHACLDLTLLAQHGVSALGWDSRLQALLPADLTAAAFSLPWVQGEGSPLVLDGSRLSTDGATRVSTSGRRVAADSTRAPSQ